MCYTWVKSWRLGILSGQQSTKASLSTQRGRRVPTYGEYPNEEAMSPPMGHILGREDTCSHRRATQSRHPGGPVPLMPDAHTNASQLRNSSQRTLRSSHLAQGRAPSNMAHMTTRLKAAAKLLIPILQLFKQIKCSHELDNQELPYKGENC